MWRTYPDIQNELEATLSLIESTIQTDNVPVKNAIIKMINAGGKLLRPAYCLLFSEFQETDRQKMIALAAAVETLHTATLIHDDIIDDSPVRRGLPSIQAEFDRATAVYAGDYLFVVCFKLLSNYASSLRSVQQDGQSMERILNGELAQMARRYDLDMTMDQYLHQVSGKTGQLFALSCFIGAYESNASTFFAKKAEDIGLNIGIAFQLMDDILDYTSSEADFGKPVHEDMKQGVYSAPLILAMHADPAIKSLLGKQTAMTDEDVATVVARVSAVNGVARAHDLAQAYTDKALKALQKLPDKPARATLIQLTKQLLQRTM
ncbi:geranylgeranyl pyrophosphate synthase [Lacticaseibacillus brantae DSM 23927]|uniref:Geranylgeranyl pyrophosphate synthase n=2 Tax=Lacticaseibacillus brantae TaxID=943673 RepID=A0A0R2AVR9_9LACO|nr:geranylgeranyl pyrophosphate synthase [Lacticaseibacillus brantae DSM 23927]